MIKSVLPDKKSIVIDTDEFESLDEFHQSAAVVLQRQGRVIIRKVIPV